MAGGQLAVSLHLRSLLAVAVHFRKLHERACLSGHCAPEYVARIRLHLHSYLRSQFRRPGFSAQTGIHRESAFGRGRPALSELAVGPCVAQVSGTGSGQEELSFECMRFVMYRSRRRYWQNHDFHYSPRVWDVFT